jgi:hypothetical protein
METHTALQQNCILASKSDRFTVHEYLHGDAHGVAEELHLCLKIRQIYSA